ncbi:MAG: hypothetical protein ACI4AA_01545 [Lachnospiraceae bacterium]
MGKSKTGILMIFSLVVFLAACGRQDTEETAAVKSNSSYVGTVSAITSDMITLSTDDGDITIEFADSVVFGREMDKGELKSERPEGATENGQGETPPERPEGATENGQDGTPPERSEGTKRNDDSGMDSMERRSGNLTFSDISVGDTVTVNTNDEGKAVSVTLSDSGMSDMGNMENKGAMGMNSGVDSYDAATEFASDASESGKAYTSVAKDENAIHVLEGAKVALDNAEITRQSADSTGGDASSFYGVGAAALVTDGTLTITNSTIDSDAAGGAGVFAYGSGTAYVADTTIRTARDTSGGIHVAGGGTLYAWDLTVETNGESSAAIRSDRGSGTMVVDGGSYISNGVGSPAVYSTADITVNNAELISNGSEAACIEGMNTIRLFDCNLSGNMQDLSQNDCTWNVILYQSMSGDSEVGNSTFEMVGGTLTAGNGGMFYTTNTESTFLLSDVDITCDADSEFFLKCTGNTNQRGWGTAGENGADCRFTAIDQVMEGNVIWDSISQLDMYILEDSTLTGAVINDESAAGEGGNSYAALYIDKTGRWIVTGDSVLSSLHSAGIITDAEGNTVSIIGTDGKVYVDGSSQYTITVNSYDNDVDVSEAATLDNWNDFAVTKP